MFGTKDWIQFKTGLIVVKIMKVEADHDFCVHGLKKPAEAMTLN